MSALRTTFAAFAVRDYRYLVAIVLLWSLVVTLTYVAGATALYAAADVNWWRSVAMFYFAQGATVLVFGLFAAVLVDCFEKNLLARIAMIAAAIVLLLIGLVILTGQVTIGWLVGFGVLLGIPTSLLLRLSDVWVGELVPKRLLANGVILLQATLSVVALVGPVLGTVIFIELDLDPGWTFVILACLLPGALWAASRLPRTPPAVRPEKRRSIRQELVAAFRYVAGTRRLRILALFGVVFGSASGASTLSFSFLQSEFDRLPRDSTIAIFAVAVLTVLAIIVVAGLFTERRSARIILVFGLVMALGACLTAAGWTYELVLAAHHMTRWAASAVALMIAVSVMAHARPDFYGRAMMVVMMGWGVGSAISAGWLVLAAEIGTRETLALLGGIALAATVGMFFAWRRTRGLPPEPGSAVEAIALAAAPRLDLAPQLAAIAVSQAQKTDDEVEQAER